MAAVEITNVIPANSHEQEDAWLYGDPTNKDPATQSTLSVNATEFVSKVQNGNGDHSASESDSDDDDDVQITIGEINKNAPATFGMPPPYGGPPQITPITQPKTVSVITAPPPIVTQSTLPTTVTSKRTIDVNAVGNINGVPIYDYDIDTMCEDKPWRVPGADLTDYFNYGFNEDSWKAYCGKQKTVRGIAHDKNKELHIPTVSSTPVTNTLPELPKLPGAHIGGSIGVIGGKKDNAGLPQPMPPQQHQHQQHQHQQHQHQQHQHQHQQHQHINSIPSLVHQPRLMLPASVSSILFPHMPQQAFLPVPQLAPPGLAPPMNIRPCIKQEDGSNPMPLPPSSGPLPPPTGMFPPPGMPSMLPPPGSNMGNMVPPMMLPPPAFSDESEQSEEEAGQRKDTRTRRSHSRERKRSRERRSNRGEGGGGGSHRERSAEHRSRSRRSPRKEKKSRKSSRADEGRHRHRDEERSKRSRRKKEEDAATEPETTENGVEAEQ